MLFQSLCTINGKVFTFLTDAVHKLDLKDEPQSSLYKLAWLQQDNNLIITRRALITFGSSYKAKMYCDIVPMNAYHLLLGRPWKFDRHVIHDCYLNIYNFTFANHKFVLKLAPLETSIMQPTTILFLQRTPLIAAMHDA